MTRTDRDERMSIMVCDTFPLTSFAYLVEAKANSVTGYEYAHHATLNFLIDFLKRVGLHISVVKRKSERKKSIFEAVSKLPVIDAQAKLAILGAAKNKKKTGRNIAGSRSLPDNL